MSLRCVLPLVLLLACGSDSSSNNPGSSSGSNPNGADGGDGGPNGGVGSKESFRGPLNMGPDPFMVFHDGFYYLSTTQGDALRMWKARTVGELLSADVKTVWTDTDPSRNRELWAPSFFFIDGKWYLYYCADDGVDLNHRLYVIESDGADPMGPYHFKAKLNVPNSERWAIDGELLQQGGKLYIMWSGQNDQGARNLLYIAPMSNPWTISGPRVYIPAEGGCAEVREGPSIVQHDNTSFMVYSACDTGKPDYQLWMKSISMDADPLVPDNWKQHKGAIMKRNDPAGIFGPGHNGFFKSPDGTEDWIVYHAKSTAAYTYDGRTTRIDRVSWGKDGLPSLGDLPRTGSERAVPAGDPGGGPIAINDDEPTIKYDGDWKAKTDCKAVCYKGDDHEASDPKAIATIPFKGTRISLLATREPNAGIAAVSIDDGPEHEVDFYMSMRHGEQLIYVSRPLTSGDHKLKIRPTGKKAAASSGTTIGFDRAEVSTR